MDIAFACSKEAQISVLRVNVDMARNSFSKEIEAVLHFTDITAGYLVENVPQKIYQKNYENIIIIDANRKQMIKTDVLSSVLSEYLKREELYEGWTSYDSQKDVVDSESEKFKNVWNFLQ